MGKSAIEWLSVLEEREPSLLRRFREIYGDDPGHIEERRGAYLRLVREAVTCYGPRARLRIFRAPGRINLKGVHIDHRGGHTNYICIAREILLAAEPRVDDRVILRNVERERYDPREFGIREELPPEGRRDWLSYIENVRITPGDWGNYPKSAILRLQDRLGNRPLRGMNLLIDGNFRGSGLSSSSALVVATMLSAVALNGLDLSKDELVTLTGEGEWYVGTRGGMGDQAAMMYGRRGYVAHIGFFPITCELLPFFEGYRVIVADSMREARKAAGARNAYNNRVTSYELGFSMIRQMVAPHLRERLHHLRDLLDLQEVEIYQLLKGLPETITREDTYHQIEDHKKLDRLFMTHDEPEDGYPIRQICLFGLSECKRSQMCADLLRKADAGTFGRLMNISHNGDRVVSFDARGEMIRWDSRLSDGILDQLISDTGGDDPGRREHAALYRQPGGYRCSCEEMDYLVDLSKRLPGVAGAGLTGAGLGGNVLILVREEAVESVIGALAEGYYHPRGLPVAAEPAVSVEGAGEII